MTELAPHISNPQSLDKTALETAVLHHLERIRIHGRNMVAAAWNAGQYLTEMKSRIEHGEWTKWLQANNIHPRLAQRVMQIGTIPSTDSLRFNTLEEAYKSTKQIEASTETTPDHPEIQDQPTPLTAADKRIIEMDNLRSETVSAQQQLAEERAKREEAERVAAAFKSRSDHEQGFEEDRSIIGQERERARQYATRIIELQNSNKELQMETMALKRVIKNKDLRIHELEELLDLNPSV